ncbi:unnamed protein product [Pleuronectes platessa]|uniref:Uncharacterized protein n=1 Tax=Pleuronectes platessa TaxID=8262 RepID=A0A9N7V797_PLEPL|nr:unnamed protein product [Pleuronectes platessa]
MGDSSIGPRGDAAVHVFQEVTSLFAANPGEEGTLQFAKNGFLHGALPQKLDLDWICRDALEVGKKGEAAHARKKNEISPLHPSEAGRLVLADVSSSPPAEGCLTHLGESPLYYVSGCETLCRQKLTRQNTVMPFAEQTVSLSAKGGGN